MMVMLLGAMCLLLQGVAVGQTPGFAWAKEGVTVGGDGYSAITYLATDYQGNSYVSGTFYNLSVAFGGDTLYNSADDYWSLFVVKYDPQGNVLWAVQPKGLFWSYGRSIAVDPVNGKVYVTANFAYTYNSTLNNGSYLPGYFGSYTFSQSTTNHQFIAQLDANTGNVGWVKEYADAISFNTITTYGNDLYVGGTFSGSYFDYSTSMTVDTPVSFGNGIVFTNKSNYGNASIFLAKYDNQGNTLWVQPSRVPCGSGVSADNVTVDKSGNPIIVGDFANCIIFNNDSFVNDNHWMYTAKYDSSGNLQWVRTNGSVPVGAGAGYNSVNKVVCDENNNVIICGVYFYILTWGHDTLNSNSGNYQTFVVKYDSSGNELWALDPGAQFNTSFGGPSVATDKSNNIYLIMTYERPFAFDTFVLKPIDGTDNESRDFFVAKMNANGQPLWIKSVGGSLDDYGSDITTDTAGDVFITGCFASPDCHFDTITLSSPGAGLSIFTAKIGPSTNPDVVTFTVSDTAICQNQSVTFSDQSTGSITGRLWTFSGGSPATSTSSNPTVTYNQSGSYAVKLIDVFSPGTDSLVRGSYINVRPLPLAGNITAASDSICAGATANLNDTGNSSGIIQWQSSSSTTGYTNIVGADSSGYSSSPSQTAYYRVVVNNTGCSDTSAPFLLVVDSLPAPPVVTAADSIICTSDSTLINSSGSYSTYQWNDGDTRPYTYANEAGGYWVSVTDVNGCSAVSAHREITTYPVPSVSITEQGDTLASFGSVLYQWFVGDSLIPGADKSVYIATQTGYYAVEVTDSNGCKSLSTATYVATGITEMNGATELAIYPNPATGLLNIQYSNGTGQSINYEILNTLGQRIWSGILADDKTTTLDISQLPRGVYLIQLHNDAETISRKIVIQ